MKRRAERDAHKALALAAELGAHLGVPDVLECLAGSAARDGSLDEAARLITEGPGMQAITTRQ